MKSVPFPEPKSRRPQPVLAMLFRASRQLRRERFDHKATRGELVNARALVAHRTAERDDARDEAKRAQAALDFLVAGRIERIERMEGA